ncbi:MAG: replicative DNA helicase, partial [Candidatus Sericytochromatia bacterium]
MEKIPPNNIDAERAVLGAMLLDKEAVVRALEIVHFSYFYLDAHQVIFKAVLDLYNHNKPIDLVTVSEQLSNMGMLQDAGDYKYLLDLAESVPTTANVEQYARIVEEKYIRREMIRISSEISYQAYESSDDIAKIIEDAERNVFNIGQKRFTKDLVHIKELVSDSFETLSQGYSEDPTRLLNLNKGNLTGISDLDALTGGLNPSDLIILAARPAMGKTAFCLNIAVNIAMKEKLPVAIFSLEMSKEQITQRILSAVSEVNSKLLKNGLVDKEQFGKVTKAVGDLYNAPLFIDDTSSLTPMEMRAKIRRLKAEHKKLGAVIVDYLQLMDLEGSENRVNEISKITRSLKRLAREMEVPVIALSQLSRSVEQRQNKRPQLSDLRESGSIEQDADIVMFIYRDEYY